MNYSVFILARAQRELTALPKRDYERVKSAIAGLSQNPRPAGCVKLTGREGWRLRVGQYRVVYEIDYTAQVVTILNIGHRREIYR